MTDLKKMLLGVGSLSMAGSVTAQQAPASEKGEVPTPPNILFLVVDDLKPNIGPYGDPIARTPAFDRIAASGVPFLNNYCQFPLSGPTRASVLTGLRPDHTGVWTLDGIFRRNNPEIVSLPQLFAAHGYETVGIGKVYHPLSDETYNNDPVSWTKPYIKPQAPVYMLPEGKPVTECVDVPDNAYFDGRVADEAVAWIDSLSRSDKPFFLAVGFIRPHLPFVAPEKYWDLYDRDKMPLAEFQSMSSDPVPCAYHNSNEVKAYTDVPSFHSYMPGQELDAEIQRRLVHGYYACTSYTDAQIGRVLDALRKVGLDDNTIVVVWGDHGYHLGDHGLWSKLTNFEAPTRTLLMMSVPGMTRGQQCRTMTEFVDIYPTVCELAGIEPPSWIDGTSLVPVLKNPRKRIKRYAFMQANRREIQGYSIRDSRYRYVDELKRMGVVLKRAQYFITCKGFSRGVTDGPEATVRALLDPAAFGVGTEQLSLFAAPAVQELAAQGMRPASAAREVCEEAVSCLARQM